MMRSATFFRMGTHPNGPSKVVMEDGSKITLDEWLEVSEHGGTFASWDEQGPRSSYFCRDTGAITNRAVALFHSCLRYCQLIELCPSRYGCPATSELFYILRVVLRGRLQAHPDKELAKRLHHDYPDIYKDPNHKPELACALSNFEALCGFRPKKSILEEFRRTPELMELVNPRSFEAFQDHVMEEECDGEKARATAAKLFEEYISSEEPASTAAVQRLMDRLKREDSTNVSISDQIALRLHSDFPFDIGIFAPYWLNYVQLDPGQSLFMEPNEPHAYLKGDCVECMACSDNVVRAGLTGKFKDVQTLCSMLTYNMNHVPISAGERIDARTVKYQPGTSEFILYRIDLAQYQRITIIKFSHPSICLVLSGSGQTPVKWLTKGQVYAIEGGHECVIESGASGISFFQISSPENDMSKS
eukprot:gb/GECG01011681.1/.p1 GENE.gb/GECG01011681.1/~~gb/GECG01011681.1/.p1  ORF type:complete len:417 (+),score=33.83 gb/GECG01011681.1/:1-1251(+)